MTRNISEDKLKRLQDEAKCRRTPKPEAIVKPTEQTPKANAMMKQVYLDKIYFVDGSDIEEARLMFTRSGHFRPLRNVINEVFKLKLTKLPNKIKVEKTEKPKVNFRRLKKYVTATPTPAKIIEMPVVPDEKKPIVRPPAIYSNSSPYGIASEMLMQQGK